MKPDFKQIDIKQVSASKVVGPNNADWQTPELIDVKPIYTKEDLQGMVEKFKKLIADNGTLGEVEEWGKRRLAYEINDETEGYYTLINFTSDSEFPQELNRIYSITDGVLRFLVVRKDA